MKELSIDCPTRTRTQFISFPPFVVTFLVIYRIEKAQSVYLRTDSYASYRKYCTRRIGSKSTTYPLTILLFFSLEKNFWRAERAWAYGMHLREFGAKRHAISRFKKAVKYAQSCQHSPYTAWMQASLAFERQQWTDSLIAFKQARQLSFAKGPAEVFSRYCEYQLEGEGLPLPTSLPADVNSVQQGLEQVQISDSGFDITRITKHLVPLDPNHISLSDTNAPKRINLVPFIKAHKECAEPELSFAIQLAKAWNHLRDALLHKSLRKCRNDVHHAQLLLHSINNLHDRLLGYKEDLLKVSQRILETAHVHQAEQTLSNPVTSKLLPVPAKPIFYDLVSFELEPLPVKKGFLSSFFNW